MRKVVFEADTLDRIRELPEAARQRAGYEIAGNSGSYISQSSWVTSTYYMFSKRRHQEPVNRMSRLLRADSRKWLRGIFNDEQRIR